MFRKLCGFSFLHSPPALPVIFIFLFFLPGCRSTAETAKSSGAERLNNYPSVILWAWERPENLRFLDAEKFGVAFLAQTLYLRGGDGADSEQVNFRPRRQPLEVSPETFLIAVTRIETDKTDRPSLSGAQKKQIIERVVQTLKLPRVRAVQLDFDVLESERDFYREILEELRAQLPENVSLTITALASWCAEDDWLNGLPVDEAVPMAFRMGTDDKSIRAFLASGKEWNAPLCRSSYGVALDEPLKTVFKPDRRFYLFSDRPWRTEDLKRLPKEMLPGEFAGD